MSEFVATFASDAALVGCVLRRLGPKLMLGQGETASGVGFFQSNDVLVRKRPSHTAYLPERLAEGLESEVTVLASGALLLPGGVPRSFHEDSTLPLRARRWLFTLAGKPEELEPVREALYLALPDSLRRSFRGDTGAETLFATFLARVRDLGPIDDPDLDASAAAKALAAAIGNAERALESLGMPTPKLAALASNGRLLVALRRGHPLATHSIEGLADCVRHELSPRTREHDPVLRAHKALKAITLVSGEVLPEGATPIAEGGIIAIDRSLKAVTL
ncbi:MAG: hypothetical protein JST92_24395 [Deltaproteobacteria bacterium]|nr:hypothetical protein [Deltaproteobacteria bacterium]